MFDPKHQEMLMQKTAEYRKATASWSGLMPGACLSMYHVTERCALRPFGLQQIVDRNMFYNTQSDRLGIKYTSEYCHY